MTKRYFKPQGNFCTVWIERHFNEILIRNKRDNETMQS